MKEKELFKEINTDKVFQKENQLMSFFKVRFIFREINTENINIKVFTEEEIKELLIKI